MIIVCPACGGTDIVRNGYTRHKKQNLKCAGCNRQFTLNPKYRVLPEVREIIINLLKLGFTATSIAEITSTPKSYIYKCKKIIQER